MSRRRKILNCLLLVSMVGIGADAFFTRLELKAAREENTALQAQLADASKDTLSCRASNLNLIAWKAQATVMMLRAADLLDVCAGPKRRLPPSRAFRGALEDPQ